MAWPKRCWLRFFSIVFLLTSFSFKLSAVDFSKKNISLGNKIVSVEMATSDEQQRRGLMFRKSLKNDTGMLFVYDKQQVLSFWMKNTFIPLSIGFFDRNKKLVDIQDMEPMKSIMQEPQISYQSKFPAKYALEMNKGWFKKNQIKLGTRFKFVSSGPK